jgi:hypothetical protein
LGAVEVVADEDDASAHLFQAIQQEPNVARATAREPVQLGHVERLDPAIEQGLDRLVEAGPLGVLAGRREVFELEFREDALAVACGGLVIQATLVGWREMRGTCCLP